VIFTAAARALMRKGLFGNWLRRFKEKEEAAAFLTFVGRGFFAAGHALGRECTCQGGGFKGK
jgi:hypothetical protein